MNFELFIVDDDKMSVFITKRMVTKSCFHPEPRLFSNGKETLDYILNNNTSDKLFCILLDINMPVMDGWELLDAINQHSIAARILVVMLTSSIYKLDKAKAKTYPQVMAFLEKPINLNVMAELKMHPVFTSFFNPDGHEMY